MSHCAQRLAAVKAPRSLVLGLQLPLRLELGLPLHLSIRRSEPSRCLHHVRLVLVRLALSTDDLAITARARHRPFGPGLCSCPAGAVTRSPESVGGSAGSTRMRRSRNMQRGWPSALRGMTASVLGDASGSQVRQVFHSYARFVPSGGCYGSMAMRVGATGG